MPATSTDQTAPDEQSAVLIEPSFDPGGAGVTGHAAGGYGHRGFPRHRISIGSAAVTTLRSQFLTGARLARDSTGRCSSEPGAVSVSGSQ